MKNFYVFLLIISSTMQAQLVELESIINSSGDSRIRDLTTFENDLMFVATNGDPEMGSSGQELFSFTTNEETELVHDFLPGANGFPSYLRIFDDKLFLNAYDIERGGSELYSYDGAEVVSIPFYEDVNSNAKPLFVYNEKLYLVGRGEDGQPGRLLQFDGTTASPALGSGNEIIQYGANFAILNGKLICFMENSLDNNPNALYEYDFEDGSFTLIKSDFSTTVEMHINSINLVGDKVFFMSLSNLWVSDGTEENTQKVEALEGYVVNNLFEWNNKLYFGATTGFNEPQNLFVYNPEDDSLSQISSIDNSGVNNFLN